MKINQIKALDAILRSKLNRRDETPMQNYVSLKNEYDKIGIEGDAKKFLNDKLKTDGYLSDKGELTAKGYFFIENEGYVGEYNKLKIENTLKLWIKRMTIASALSVIITMFLIGIQTYYLRKSTNETKMNSRAQIIEMKHKEKKESYKNLSKTNKNQTDSLNKQSSLNSLQPSDSLALEKITTDSLKSGGVKQPK